MSDQTNSVALSDLYCAILPSVGGKPLRQLPGSLYGYVYATSFRQQIVLCLLTVLVFPLTLAPLELQRRIVDGAIAQGDAGALASLAALYLGAVVGLAGLKYFRNMYANRVAEGIARRLRRRFVEAKGSGFQAAAKDGTRQAILASEAETLGGFVSESIAFPLLKAGIVVSVAGYMLLVEPRVALTALVLLLPAVAVIMLTQPMLNRLSEEKISETRALGEQVISNGADESGRTAGKGEADGDTAELHISRIYALRLRFGAVKFAAKGITNIISHMGPLSVLVVGGWFVIQGEAQVGTVIAFMSGYERITSPMRDLLNFYRRLALMRVQYRLIRDAGRTQALA